MMLEKDRRKEKTEVPIYSRGDIRLEWSSFKTVSLKSILFTRIKPSCLIRPFNSTLLNNYFITLTCCVVNLAVQTI